MNSVLVTGSAGVLGRALVPSLAAGGFAPRPYDRLGSPGRDVRDSDALDRAMRGCAGIVHLAGCSRVACAESKPEQARADNVMATAALLEVRRAQPSPPWLLFASSREVYGVTPSAPVAEHAPLQPINQYGRTKVEAEQLLMNDPAGRATSLRLANVYGVPWDYPGRVVPAFIQAAESGSPLVVRGPNRELDLLHITDVAAAVVAAARCLYAGRPLPAALNICSGHSVRLIDLAMQVRERAGSPSRMEIQPGDSHEVDRFVGDPSLAAHHLSWRATTPLSLGLQGLMKRPITTTVSP